MNYVAANSVSNTLKHTFSSSRGFSPVCLPSFSHPPTHHVHFFLLPSNLLSAGPAPVSGTGGGGSGRDKAPTREAAPSS